MNIDIKALLDAARADTESRIAHLDSGETLGLAAELNAAFLCGWRFAMKQMKSALESQADADAAPAEGGER